MIGHILMEEVEDLKKDCAGNCDNLEVRIVHEVEDNLELREKITKIQEIVKEYMHSDGAHHKQWALEEIARILEVEEKWIPNEGIA